MASASGDKPLSEIVRDCVREELQLQRGVSNSNLLLRTRNLIANSAVSASRQVANSIVINPSLASQSLPGSVPSTTGNSSLSEQSSTMIPGAKRASTYNHPWRFKKGKQKMPKKQDFTPKAIHLLDMYMAAEHEEESDQEPKAGTSRPNYIPDYPIRDEDILLKGYLELGSGQTEQEIRDSICQVIKERFPYVERHHFEFVKRDRNKVSTPVVNKSLTWDYKHVKELCGQGKIYVRLNVPKECIEMIAEKSDGSEGDEDLMKSALSPTPAKHLYSPSPVPIIQIKDDEDESGSGSAKETPTNSFAKPTQPSTSKKQSDKEKLRELLPCASENQLDSALSQNYSLASAANALLQDYFSTVGEEASTGGEGASMTGEGVSTSENNKEVTLSQITKRLAKELTGKKKKLEIDQDDLVNDAVAYYKSVNFDASCPVRISFQGQPAVDTGGVLRQFFTELFEKLADGDLIELFEGDITRKVPSYRPQAVMSGMLEMIGKMIAHSIVQGGPGFPFLALPCYYYLVTGDVMCAMAYCNCLDIPDSISRNIVFKIMDASTDEEMENLSKDDEVLNLLSQCGETSILNLSTKVKVIQGVAMYEVLSKRKVALDQMRNGLKTLGVLSEMSNHPGIFESVFTFKSIELTSATVKECFDYPVELNEKEKRVKEMVIKFIDLSTPERLQQLMQFCTGGKGIPSVPNFKVKVNFHDDSYISSSTCIFSLGIPNFFQGYGIFEASMLSAISSSGKSFTNV